MIIFVEDQIESVDLYVDEITDMGIETRVFPRADEALDFFRGRNVDIKVVVLDVMLPATGIFSSAATSDGLTTGLRLYTELRKISEGVSIVVLTNLTTPVVADTVGVDPNACVFRKDKIFYDEFAAKVKRLHGGERIGAENGNA